MPTTAQELRTVGYKTSLQFSRFRGCGQYPHLVEKGCGGSIPVAAPDLALAFPLRSI
jgi:hypothetical protein